MKRINTSICLGLGDNLVARIVFDSVKHEYDQIRISHDQNIMRHYKNGDVAYEKFLKDIGNLLFTEPPYYFDNRRYPPIHTLNNIRSLSSLPCKSSLQPILCKGTPLNINEEYIVITTKIRGVSKIKFMPLSIELWRTLNKLSEKYVIVVMGEREVERNVEYRNMTDTVFGLYDQIISNLPPNRIIDLTVPALGNTAPNLTKIQQDAFIIKGAKFVVTLGLGGNVWLAVAASNKVIGFRDIGDNDDASDLIFNPNFTSVNVTKNWNEFITRLLAA